MDLIDLSGFPWWAMPAEAQVALILARYAMYGIIPVIIPSPLLFVPLPTKTLPTQRGTDYAHIRKLADDTGYVFYVEPGRRREPITPIGGRRSNSAKCSRPSRSTWTRPATWNP